MVSTTEVLKALESGGYRRRGSAIGLGGFRVTFGEVLTGPGDDAGLVLVDDSSRCPDEDLVRRTRSLLLGLESSGSRRHVALVVLGQPANETLRVRLGAMVRLVWVPTSTTVEDVEPFLEPLLRLRLPSVVPATGAGLQQLRSTESGPLTPEAEELIQSASSGSVAVLDTFVRQMGLLAREDDGADE